MSYVTARASQSVMVCAVLMTTLFAACDRSPDVAGPGDDSRVEPRPFSQNAIRTFDDDMAAIADSQPGFAGFYLDGDQLIVRLAGTAQVAAARPLVRKFISQRVDQGGASASRWDAAVAGMSSRRADYDFRQLYNWRSAVDRAVFRPGSGVTSTDVDEQRNRVVIGVENAGAIDGVLRDLETRGLPRAAIIVEVAPLVEPSQNVNDMVRPVVAGTEINNNCTMAYTVKRVLANGQPDPDRYFLVNSHCTGSFGANPGFTVGQDDASDQIGVEFLDPSLFTSATNPACPSGQQCRYSDAALIKFDAGPSWDWGRVAWPSYDGWFDIQLRRNVSGASDPVMGQTLYKIGRTTGRTSGTVNGTCVNTTATDGVTRLCSGRASYSSAGGDSGSPVVELKPDGSVVGKGINWGSGGGNGYFSITSMWQTELLQALGGGQLNTVRGPSFSVSMFGSDFIIAPGSYQYQANVAGGVAPYSYLWEYTETEGGPYTNIGNGTDVWIDVNGGTAAIFWVKVTVTESGDNESGAWETRVVNQSGNPCAPENYCIRDPEGALRVEPTWTRPRPAPRGGPR